MKYSLLAAALAAFATTGYAHTWVEQLNVIASNGTMLDPAGFPRGNVKRGTPNFGDPAMVNLLPPNDRPINTITDQDLMCKSTQTQQTQTDGSPRLQAAAGASVALRYQENGHVSLPQNQPGKPDNRGTIYVYGTTQSSPDDKFLSIHRQWTPDGTGGDGRGVLLATRDYDDSQCYQVNSGSISTQRQQTFAHTANSLMGADLWCQSDVQIPTTAPSGKPYTLYWVWDWPTMPGTAGFPDGKQEIYTTCMDIDITAANAASGSTLASNKAVAAQFVKQDFANAAVAGQFSDIANPTAVTGQFIPFSGQASPTPGSPAASSQASAPPAADTTVQATTTAQVATSTIAQTQSAGFGPGNSASPSDDGRGRGRHSRPQVSPIGSTSAPLPQATDNATPIVSGDNPTVAENTGTAVSNTVAETTGPSKAASNTAAANTGTAISNAAAGPAATVTAAGGAAASIVTRVQTMVSTVVQTQFQTIYQNGAGSKRAGPTERPVLENSLANSGASSSGGSAKCSRTEAAYRLRARKPFVIVPEANVEC